MTVIVEVSIPGEEFILGRALEETEELSVELQKMIPTGGAAIPYFWVIGGEKARFDTVLDRESELSAFEVIDEVNGRSLYRAEWDPAADTFLQRMVDHDAMLQEAGGDADSWSFQLRFPDSQSLSRFHTDCREQDIDLTVESLFNPIEPQTIEVGDLTEAQRALIERVYDAGYFEVPRKVTLVEVAGELSISDQAVNERLRRGLSTLIEATLESDIDTET